MPSKIAISYFCFAAFVIAVSTARGELSFLSYLKLKEKKIMINNRIDELTEQNDIVKTEIFRLNNFPAYASKVLKDRYHMLEKGETIVFLEN